MKGVVLMGGKSSRFGQDKAYYHWHGSPLFLLSYKKLSCVCDEVFLSVNQHQLKLDHENIPVIIDLYNAEGPIAGMISAFRNLQQPLFFLSCDMPYVTEEDIGILYDLYDAGNDIVTYYNNAGFCYEPLLSVWSMKSLQSLEHFFSQGYRSINQFLKQQDTDKIYPTFPDHLKSINQMQDLD